MGSALSAAAVALLPSATEAPRCADHQRWMAVDPAGSAFHTDVLVVADIAPPWPADVLEHPYLRGAEPAMADGHARIMAAVPADDGTTRVRVFWRERSQPRGVVMTVDGPGAVTDVLTDLATTPARDLVGARPAGTDVVLVCTHGARDVCCGGDGTRLATELAAGRGDVQVVRCSHLGGHRFAPTAMTLADGRLWAHLDRTRLDVILDRADTTAAVAGICRGWWGAAPGPAQVAERAVWARAGWAFDEMDRSVVVESEDDHHRCVVRWGDDQAVVLVTEAREVPTIACRQPGGLPAKPATEYRVLEVSG